MIQEEAPLPLGRTLAIALQIAASLADAHAHGIVRRDLTPHALIARWARARIARLCLDAGMTPEARSAIRLTQYARGGG